MYVVKANELIKTSEKRGPFFAFDEIYQNPRAYEYFFDLQKFDNNIGRHCVAFHNAKNNRERVDAWRLLLDTFDEFRRTLYYLKLELKNYNARALIDGIWVDCLDLCSKVKELKPNKTRCLLLHNQSNISWLLIRACSKDVLNYYQDKLDKAWQDVLKDNE